MPVTEQQILDVQAENFAEDVEILPEMTSWTIKQVEEYFVTCGEVMPDANEAPPAKEQEYMVIYHPRIAIRKEATADGAIVASLALGTKVRGTPFKNDVGEWIKLSDGRGFSMIAHEKLGKLLESRPDAAAPIEPPSSAPEEPPEPKKDSLKVTFELKKGRKACGANIKTVDAAGASRDTLFDHFVLQELLEDFQVKFRAEGIPDNMYNTDHANDTECVTWCAMGGQIGPIPEKGGKRKAAAGGMRQRIEHLGGLRCIVAEKDEGSDEPPKLIVLLAHGIHVLSDDLYGLAYHIAKPRVRFILPGGPEVSSDYDPLDKTPPLRPPRQWFKWADGDTPDTLKPKVEAAASMISACAAEALKAAPGAKLVIGGFSQGAAVTLQAAPKLKPTALVQLSAQAPLKELPAGSLDGVKLLVAAGMHDGIAPITTAKALYDACAAAGATPLPMHTYDGVHEVTLCTVHKMGDLLGEQLEEAVAVS